MFCTYLGHDNNVSIQSNVSLGIVCYRLIQCAFLIEYIISCLQKKVTHCRRYILRVYIPIIIRKNVELG